jgi:hypothetical protein
MAVASGRTWKPQGGWTLEGEGNSLVVGLGCELLK